MLHKSFKPQKCKTSVKLASSRIKLLRNKRGEHVKQLKKELAQLLKTNQDQTARIRVEHVIREEKTMAGYELIELYCELIVARLSIIESQKNCPIDLKEAISSVIFASPRCEDIPELKDVCKHFKAKYGKEFVTSALELRPNSGVNAMIAEKLSARPPDTEAKVKMLTKIAADHGIDWQPKSFGESVEKPHSTTSTSFENGSNFTTEAVHPELIPPSYQKHESDKKPTPSKVTRSNPSFISSDVGNNPSTDIHPGSRIPEKRDEGPKSNQNFGAETVTYQQNWDMNFKDAASAARAAAESAERASRAAKAAAQLASYENVPGQSEDELILHQPIHNNDAVIESLQRRNSGGQQQEDKTVRGTRKQYDDSDSFGRRSGKSFSSPSNPENYNVVPGQGQEDKAVHETTKPYNDPADGGRRSRKSFYQEDKTMHETGTPYVDLGSAGRRSGKSFSSPSNPDKYNVAPDNRTFQQEDEPMTEQIKKDNNKLNQQSDEMKDNLSYEWENEESTGYASYDSDNSHEGEKSIYIEEPSSSNYTRTEDSKQADVQKSDVFNVRPFENDFEDHDVLDLHNQKQQDTFNHWSDEAGTQKVEKPSWDRQQSLRDHSSVIFDDSGSYNGDVLDLDNINDGASSFSENQESNFPDFSSHDDPWHPPKGRSSLENHSMKRADSVESEGSTKKAAYPLSSDEDVPVGTYDSDDSVKDTLSSPLWSKGLAGGAKNKASHPPYVVNPLVEVHTAHKETGTATSYSISKSDDLKHDDAMLSPKMPSSKADKQKSHRNPLPSKSQMTATSSDSESSDEDVISVEKEQYSGSGSSRLKQSTYKQHISSSKSEIHQEPSNERPSAAASRKSNIVPSSGYYSDLTEKDDASLSSTKSDSTGPTSQRPSDRRRIRLTTLDSFEREDDEPNAKYSDPRSSIPYSTAGNDDELPRPKPRYAESKPLEAKSRRTRPSTLGSKHNTMSQDLDVPEVMNSTPARRKPNVSSSSAPEPIDDFTANGHLKANRNPEFSPSKPPIRSAVTLPTPQEQKSPKSSKKPVSKFAPPSSWKEDMSTAEELEPTKKELPETAPLKVKETPESSSPPPLPTVGRKLPPDHGALTAYFQKLRANTRK